MNSRTPAMGGTEIAAFSMDNPVLVTCMITGAIMLLKIMGQGWLTVYRMLKSNSGLVNPEDLRPGLFNKAPAPEQLDLNDYVDRSRRMHRNNLENIPAFLACGVLFVAAGSSYLLANNLMYGFVGARLAHTIAYASRQSHKVSATFYTIGSLAVIFMAVNVLLAVIFP